MLLYPETPCALFLYLAYWGGIRGNTTSFGETWNLELGWTNFGEAPFIDLHLTLLLCTSRCCQFTQTVRRLVTIDNIKCNNQKQAGILPPPPYPTPQERDDGFHVATQCNAVCWCTQQLHAHALVSSPRAVNVSGPADPGKYHYHHPINTICQVELNFWFLQECLDLKLTRRLTIQDDKMKKGLSRH